jgi:molecular chaperone DnaK (HSP70)
MLEHTALLGALQTHAQDTYKVLTIDIGGYTTDFALTGFNTDPGADHLFPDPSQRSENFDWTSEVGGVQDLDERLAGRLSAEKQMHFRNILNDTRQTRLEEFHRIIYGQLGYTFFQLPVPELRIAEDPDEQRMIAEVLEQFASHVCQWADNFVARCGSIDEVVLTGGGFSIPTIRNRVAQSLRKWSPKYIIAPHDERAGDDDFIAGCDSEKVDFAPALLNRCSTAFGGTSILFG